MRMLDPLIPLHVLVSITNWYRVQVYLLFTDFTYPRTSRLRVVIHLTNTELYTYKDWITAYEFTNIFYKKITTFACTRSQM